MGATRVHAHHKSIDFRFMRGSKSSLHLEDFTQDNLEQGILKPTIQTIQEDAPLSVVKEKEFAVMSCDAPPSYSEVSKTSFRVPTA